MNDLYTVAQIRAIEAAAAATLPPGALMQRAGQAAANVALALIAGLPKNLRSVLLLAGPGNNGGDALEAAANLAHTNAGVEVSILHLPGSQTVSAETADALARARASQARFIDALPERAPGLVVDGLFGIGLKRPLDVTARALVDGINQRGWPVLALDVPSGLDADTGSVIGPKGAAIHAMRTLTFIADKPGLHTLGGRDHAGEVQVDGLGLAADLYAEAAARLNDPALFEAHLQARRHDSHKGSYGDVFIVGGAHGMLGAPMLAARCALYAGAGRVIAALLDGGPGVDSIHPEIMFRAAASQRFEGGTVVIGPGLGGSAEAMAVLAEALASDCALVLDADGINLVAASVDLGERLRERAARGLATIMTPHPLEAARLLALTTPEVQQDRLGHARALAARFQAVVVLKGSGTVIAAEGEGAIINANGNPGLATGGSGDVLAGLCGALLAQGWPAHAAAAGAVWLHGAAADRLASQGAGPIGMTAGELPAAVRAVFNELVAGQAQARAGADKR
ncbi:MAG: NAD(P)H-hydrate dehydratase [Massilia sp.]